MDELDLVDLDNVPSSALSEEITASQKGKKQAVGLDGSVTGETVIALNKDDLENGFQKPWTLVIGPNVNRDTFHKSVVAQLKNLRGDENRVLKNNFIAWYCEMFRQPNSAFYTSENLEKSAKDVADALIRVGDSTEELKNASEIPRVTLRGGDDVI